MAPPKKQPTLAIPGKYVTPVLSLPKAKVIKLANGEKVQLLCDATKRHSGSRGEVIHTLLPDKRSSREVVVRSSSAIPVPIFQSSLHTIISESSEESSQNGEKDREEESKDDKGTESRSWHIEPENCPARGEVAAAEPDAGHTKEQSEARMQEQKEPAEEDRFAPTVDLSNLDISLGLRPELEPDSHRDPETGSDSSSDSHSENEQQSREHSQEYSDPDSLEKIMGRIDDTFNSLEYDSRPGSMQDTISPVARATFSPASRERAEAHSQMAHTLKEVIQSEHMYVRSLALLRNFFVEPLLVKSGGMQVTCTPLLHMDAILQGLISRHDGFYSSMARAIASRTGATAKIHSYADLVQGLFSGTAYGDFSLYAELILALVAKQTAPFESPYIKGLQGFLESHQPKSRCMDLSLASLLQKPMGRIAKYHLFLSALQKCGARDPVVEAARRSLDAGLSRINADISSARSMQAHARHLAEKATTFPVEYLGVVRQCVRGAEARWLVHDKRHMQFALESRAVELVLFDFHLVVLDTRSQTALFVVPAGNCVPVQDDAGLCSDADTKLRFRRSSAVYELLLRPSSPVLGSYIDAASAASHVPSVADCVVALGIAAFDLHAGDDEMFEKCTQMCYFRKRHDVTSVPPVSRFRSISVLGRRRLW